MTVTVRQFEATDWPGVWRIMEPIIRAGETCPYAMDMDEDGARHMWLDVTDSAYVAETDAGEIVGTYYLKPNQPTLGAHVANAGV